MSLIFGDNLSDYTTLRQEIVLPKQSWWRRFLRLPRPAGTAWVTFNFKVGPKGEWQTMEACAEYPEGMDAIRLNLTVFIDGNEFYLAAE
jgi:hypothetical protein